MYRMSCRASSERVRVGEGEDRRAKIGLGLDCGLTENIHRPFAKDAIEYVEWGERRTAVFTRINNQNISLLIYIAIKYKRDLKASNHTDCLHLPEPYKLFKSIQTEDILETEEMCPQVRGGRPESSSGSEATKMGHKIITAELLSVAQLITTFLHQL